MLDVCNLSVAFKFQVTDKVNFSIGKGEFFALVGESGCGKSVTAMSLLRLLPVPSAKIIEGSVEFEIDENQKIDLTKIPLKELVKIRGKNITCIFQEPMQALNPVIRIKKQLLEAKNDEAEILRLMQLAGFTDTERVLNAYPHELSGGMLQRVCIVMSLLSHPQLIIADEPTTALDVTVQAQVLSILKKMAEDMGTAVLLITHNMGIVAEYAHRVAVMYAGRIVEMGDVKEVIFNAKHPYTKGLLAAIPESHNDMSTLRSIPGSVPHPKDFIAGCRFKDRCAYANEKCTNENAPSKKIISTNHEVYCYNI